MLRKFLIGAVACVMMSPATLAQSVGTGAEAKAMFDKAVTELKANEAGALAKFNKADGGFRDRDLYVYCFEKSTGKFTAHVNPALMGTDVRALKEKDGSPLGQKAFDAAKEGSITTISYNSRSPAARIPWRRRLTSPPSATRAAVSAITSRLGYYV